jgi:hypothetical protein
MFQMITGFWVTQAVGTFAELGFAEQLAHGPQTARDLATKAGTKPDATYRLLRGLASVGVLVQDSARFKLTPLGATLRIDAPGSMRDMARTMAMAPHWLPWGHLLEAVRTGSRKTGATLGTELFAYYDAHPDVARGLLRRDARTLDARRHRGTEGLRRERAPRAVRCRRLGACS